MVIFVLNNLFQNRQKLIDIYETDASTAITKQVVTSISMTCIKATGSAMKYLVTRHF